MEIVVTLFGFALFGLLGWIFGHMAGQADLLREQNDRAMAAAPSHPSEAKAGEGFYTFNKPEGWINLANPSQSWEEWTREQGAPTTKGWKVGEAKAGEDA